MATFNNLKDLFYHQLRDIYNAEKQLINSLPKIAEHISDNNLKQVISDHIEETETHRQRLDEIARQLDIDLNGETCNAMAGLIDEAESFLKEDANADVKDAGIIADAQRIEHYEISAYGTAVQYAKALDFEDIADKLHLTLEEEAQADETLNNLAVNNINQQANKKLSK